jgi:hypothetical protein
MGARCRVGPARLARDQSTQALSIHGLRPGCHGKAPNRQAQAGLKPRHNDRSTSAEIHGLYAAPGARAVRRRLHACAEPSWLRWNGEVRLTRHRPGALEPSRGWRRSGPPGALGRRQACGGPPAVAHVRDLVRAPIIATVLRRQPHVRQDGPALRRPPRSPASGVSPRPQSHGTGARCPPPERGGWGAATAPAPAPPGGLSSPFQK